MCSGSASSSPVFLVQYEEIFPPHISYTRLTHAVSSFQLPLLPFVFFCACCHFSVIYTATCLIFCHTHLHFEVDQPATPVDPHTLPWHHFPFHHIIYDTQQEHVGDAGQALNALDLITSYSPTPEHTMTYTTTPLLPHFIHTTPPPRKPLLIQTTPLLLLINPDASQLVTHASTNVPPSFPSP